MFCAKCGAELPDSAKFCGSCGASISGESNTNTNNENVKDDVVQLNVKPTYKLIYKNIIGINVWLLIFIIPMTAGLGFAGFIISTLVLLILYAIKIFFEKKQYNNYSYDFYKTKVCYKDSFLSISEKEVKYKYIREIVMRQSFIQRFFNIGTIVMFTNAETGFGNGIAIVDVENVKDVYTQIKKIINV